MYDLQIVNSLDLKEKTGIAKGCSTLILIRENLNNWVHDSI